MSALLQLDALTLRRGERLLCRALELTVEPGQCWGILGPNGAGKSTLLFTLGGLRPAQGGEIRFLGRPLSQWRRRALARHLGLLFQQRETALTGRVLETALSGRHPHLGTLGWVGPEDLRLAHEALETLGLAELAERDAATLSGGEQQRLELAVLLTQGPRLALLDEPTNHLDPNQAIQMLELVRRHFSNGRRSAIMVLHDVNLALRFCDRLLLMAGDGQWRAGPTAKLATEENLSWLYGHPVRLLRTGTAAPCCYFC